MSTDTKFSKSQLFKLIHSGRFFRKTFGNLGKKGLIRSWCSFGKSCFP